MNSDTIILAISSIAFFLAGLTVGQVIYARGIPNMQKAAVERNAAEWVVDQATGETTFEWKEVEP